MKEQVGQGDALFAALQYWLYVLSGFYQPTFFFNLFLTCGIIMLVEILEETGKETSRVRMFISTEEILPHVEKGREFLWFNFHNLILQRVSNADT